MEILNEVKQRLNIEDDQEDTKIKGYIDEITNKVKSVCNRADFPEELNYLAIKYAKDCYIYYKNKDNSNNEQLQVTSASDSGQTVNFKTIENISKDDIDLNKIIAKNQDEISMYAYMRW